ncbi:hypothetical protein AMTR_s00098p00170550, partial [Amborella trichopoda]
VISPKVLDLLQVYAVAARGGCGGHGQAVDSRTLSEEFNYLMRRFEELAHEKRRTRFITKENKSYTRLGHLSQSGRYVYAVVARGGSGGHGQAVGSRTISEEFNYLMRRFEELALRGATPALNEVQSFITMNDLILQRRRTRFITKENKSYIRGLFG